MSRQHVEVIDGREYTVTRLPQDWRLTPSQAHKRALWLSRPAGLKGEGYFPPLLAEP